MLKFFENFRNTLPLTKNAVLPAIILAVSLVGFYAVENIPWSTQLSLHAAFYIFIFSSLCILIYFNKTKPVMFISFILLSYIICNFLKKENGSDYISSPYYINLCVLVPFNLIIFYFLPQRKLFTRENLLILLIVFFELSLYENLSSNDILIGYSLLSQSYADINRLGLLMFIIGTIIILLDASINGRILRSYLLFAYVEIMFGFIYSENSTALTVFYSAATLTIFIGLCHDTYYETYKDVLTSLANRKSYVIQSSAFPLKYSVAIICIDDYERLNKGFSASELNSLIKMAANKIIEFEKDNPVYRYDKDLFIIIFKNEDKNDSFKRVEEIRRAIAGSEFVLGRRKKPVKLTVSGSIADKKRSDASSHEVLIRARKVLEKTNKFTQNITTRV
ncbi:MAG: diguanylate cyclase [Lactobacillaceae bacterium]|nr:diguanylate cyclase [Lactobacillaceae bacterium]